MDKYIGNLFNDNEWDNLSEEEKNIFLKAKFLPLKKTVDEERISETYVSERKSNNT